MLQTIKTSARRLRVRLARGLAFAALLLPAIHPVYAAQTPTDKSARAPSAAAAASQGRRLRGRTGTIAAELPESERAARLNATSFA